MASRRAARACRKVQPILEKSEGMKSNAHNIVVYSKPRILLEEMEEVLQST